MTDDHSALISGLLFHLVGPEPFGFAVDNIRFSVGEEVVPHQADTIPFLLIILSPAAAGLFFDTPLGTPPGGLTPPSNVRDGFVRWHSARV